MATLVPVDHDPFAAGPRLVPVEGNPFSAPVKPGYGEDIAKSAGIGVAKGTIGLAGFPGDIGQAVKGNAGSLAHWLGSKLGIDPAKLESDMVTAFGMPTFGLVYRAPTSKAIQGQVEKTTGPFYEPQTTPGKYAQTIGEFVPAALPGGGVRAVAGNLVKFAAIPGVASEAAGQATQGTAAEPWARAGAAVATGGAAALLARPRTAAGAIRGAIPENINPQALDAAEVLFQEARTAGVPISRAEVVQHATGGATRLADLQRVVEGSGGMREFFAPRAGQVETAGRQAFEGITPATNAPATIGPAVGQAATQTLTDVRGDINRVARPSYDAAATVRLTPQEMAQARALPGFAEAAAAVRNNPQLNRYVANLPDDSVGFLNEVKKQLDQSARNANRPMAQQPNAQVAAGYGRDATAARNIASQASPDYANALAIEAQGREQILRPLLQGPLGKLAQRDITTRKAIDAVFPANPLPNSADEIATAVANLAQRNPQAARQLVRAHVESTFNEATQRLASGANEFGGAKFAAVLRGNPQQAANLEASIRSLPQGDQVWAGFGRFLEFLEAQGTRQRIGSQTAFNQEALADLRRGTPIGEAGTMLATGGIKYPARIKEAIERWRLGRGVDELANLFTNPETGQRFRQLATAPVGSSEFMRAVGRLAVIGRQAFQSTPDEKR